MSTENVKISTATKFEVSDVVPERVSSENPAKKMCMSTDNANGNTTSSKQSICSELKLYAKNNCKEVLMETKFSSNVKPSANNGFVNTVIDCYNNHHNLVIRPDDIWMAIITQFSFYINNDKDGEKFRRQFVDFKGKRQLSVEMNASIRCGHDIFVTKMTKKIHENIVDKTIKDWMLPNFTTTTPDDIISCGIVFMATMKRYFTYSRLFKCGIPNITLEGTLEDWESILSRIEKLKSYELEKWYDMLKPILTEFLEVKKGNINVDFWNRICKHKALGSGNSYITGWLLAFAVFDEDGKANSYRIDDYPHVSLNNIPCGYVSVNVEIVQPNGKYETIMFAGHIASEALEDEFTLQPRIGWGVALKSKSEAHTNGY